MSGRAVATVTIVPDLEFAVHLAGGVADLLEIGVMHHRCGQVNRSGCEVNSSGWQPPGSSGLKAGDVVDKSNPCRSVNMMVLITDPLRKRYDLHWRSRKGRFS